MEGCGHCGWLPGFQQTKVWKAENYHLNQLPLNSGIQATVCGYSTLHFCPCNEWDEGTILLIMESKEVLCKKIRKQDQIQLLQPVFVNMLDRDRDCYCKRLINNFNQRLLSLYSLGNAVKQ